MRESRGWVTALMSLPGAGAVRQGVLADCPGRGQVVGAEQHLDRITAVCLLHLNQFGFASARNCDPAIEVDSVCAVTVIHMDNSGIIYDEVSAQISMGEGVDIMYLVAPAPRHHKGMRSTGTPACAVQWQRRMCVTCTVKCCAPVQTTPAAPSPRMVWTWDHAPHQRRVPSPLVCR